MIRKLNILHIKMLIAKIEQKVMYNMKRSGYDKVIMYLRVLSYLHYRFYIDFKNSFIEHSLKDLSRKIEKATFIENDKKKSIVLIDNICSDPIGLTQQYIGALIKGNFSVLYIYKEGHKEAPNEDIMRLLRNYDKAEIRMMPLDISGIRLAQWIYDTICHFGSKRILMHLSEWSIEECIAAYALPSQIIRYRICLADHTFWTGANCIDYLFEFRNYGCNLSLFIRGFEKSQIIYMPYYPILNKHSYEGIPVEAEGKFIFLTGGSMYKVMDKEKTFFKLCKLILDACPNSVILFATGMEHSYYSEAIETFNLKGRLLNIGYRRDICELFEKCDVFINTYPISGGLMCQYAAHFSLPILNYRNRFIEDCVNQKAPCHFTFDSDEDFVNEALKLYKDKEYRFARAECIHNAVISKDEFERNLITSLLSNKTEFEIKWEESFMPREYKVQDALYYTNEKEALFNFYYILYKYLGHLLFSIAPFDYVALQIERVKNKIKRNLYKIN